MGQPHGIGFDGLPDDRPRPEIPRSPVDLVKPETDFRRPVSLTLQLRWESALPIRAAELKSHVESPATASDGYFLAVYGVPNARISGDPDALGKPLVNQAMLRREGKKDARPSKVEVLQTEAGLVIVYVFPLSAEITPRDQRIEFDARIGRIGIAQSFNVEEMQFQGRLEL